MAGIGMFTAHIMVLDDPELQAKLEKHPQFGRQIKFIGNDVPAPELANPETISSQDKPERKTVSQRVVRGPANSNDISGR
jgi:hypothetical protein